ncbi:SagB-type dehydrogenase domain-containing protein [Candidatus Electronema halotolerans]
MPTVNVRLSLPEDSLSELLHSETKLTPYQLRQWQYQQPPVSEHPAIAKWMQAPFKEYLSLPQIALPPPAPAPTGKLDAACLAALLQQPAEISSLECYLLATELDGIAPGLHHYNKRTHCLETFSDSPAPAQPLRQQMPDNVAGLLIVTGVLTRMRLKHGERGYRYMLFEAGRVQERLLTAAAVLRLSVELLPDFFDDAVNALLGVDGVEESALFLAGLRR